MNPLNWACALSKFPRVREPDGGIRLKRHLKRLQDVYRAHVESGTFESNSVHHIWGAKSKHDRTKLSNADVTSIQEGVDKNNGNLNAAVLEARLLMLRYSSYIWDDQPNTKSWEWLFNLVEGKIGVQCGVKHFTKEGADFLDESSQKFDLIVLCAGFET